mgnify:CR=1 FL=1
MIVHVAEAAAALQAHDDILILTHRRPDGDTAGCAGALCRGLRQIGKRAYILENPEITRRYAPMITGCYPPDDFNPRYIVSTDIAEEKLFPDTAEQYKGKVDLVIEQLLERFKIQAAKKVRNYPFLMGNGIWLDSEKLDWDESVAEVLKHGTLTVGFIGLAETLVALTGKHHGESEESQKLGLRIVEHMRKRCDDEAAKTHLNFTLIATPAEGLSGRFVALDRKKYGVIKGVTDREYYTNSFHVPVYFPIKAFRKIELEAPYHSFTNAGHITYVELDGDTCKNLEAFETIIRFMHDKGVGYGSINHPLDRDPVCGYVGVINGQCPRCGRKEGEAVSQETLKMLRRKYPHMPNCCR